MAYRSYTVDRAARLSSGQLIERVEHRDVSAEPLRQLVDAWFPAGLTNHGERYLLSAAAHATLLDPAIELACELVRRAEFPAAPSRFQSLFSWRTVEDADRFRHEMNTPTAAIYAVESDVAPFRADMRCLNIRGTALVTAYGARRYWSQQVTDIHVFPGGVPQTSAWELLVTPPVRVLTRVR